MASGLSFPGPPVPIQPSFRWLRWVAVAAIVLCLASIAVLTLLIPDAYPPKGGFLPISGAMK